jgi:flagellar biosynthesis/type III secretory pathway chaperone
VGKSSADDAIRFANELHKLLELEFEALKLQKLSEIESIQEKKIPILEYLNADSIKANVKESTGEADWQSFKSIISECKIAHRRNEILVNRRIESIKNALSTLTGENKEDELEMYDKLGKLAQKKNSKGILEA